MRRNEHTTPDDVVETVRALAARGLSASMIGPHVGKTRNAVIGLCQRRGIALRGAGRPPPRPLAPKKRKGSPGGIVVDETRVVLDNASGPGGDKLPPVR